MTGFRKRNTLKKEAAKAKAIARERDERLKLRKEQRQALKVRAEENARQVESVFQEGTLQSLVSFFSAFLMAILDYLQEFGDEEPDTESETGSSSTKKATSQGIQEYEDEERLATVTVIEDCEPESFRHIHPIMTRLGADGIVNSNHKASDQSGVLLQERKSHERKSKQKKIAYETKAARKAARLKEHSRKHEKADLAGGRPPKKSITRHRGRGRKVAR